MHVSFVLFADAANLSQEGKLNILGVFDAVHVASLPAIHPRATIVVRLKGTTADVGNHMVVLRWINPRGSELWSSSADLEVTAPASPVKDIEMDLPVIAAVDLPLDTVGDYVLTVELDGRKHGETKLHVRADAPVIAPSHTAMVS